MELARVRDELLMNQKSAAAKRKHYLAKVRFDSATEQGEQGTGALATSHVDVVCSPMTYYFEGCADWRWFYPYHYAPISSGLVTVAEMISTVSLTGRSPFKPMASRWSSPAFCTAALLGLVFPKVISAAPESPDCTNSGQNPA